MSSATLSIQDVGGFPVLVCQSAERREVYPVQNPMTPLKPTAATSFQPKESVAEIYRKFFGGEE